MISCVPKELIGIDVQVEDAIHRWLSKEVSELSHYEEETAQSWKTRGETTVELCVE